MADQNDAGRQLLLNALLQRDMKDDYRAVFLKTKEGRRVLTDLLQHCGVLRPVVDLDDEKVTHFNAGRQSVGLLLIDLVDKVGYDAIIDLENQGIELTKIGEEDL